MHCLCFQVLLCEETVSLLGIRQFYKLVGSTPSSNHAATSSSTAASKPSTSREQGNDSVHGTDAGPAKEPEAASSSAPAAAAAIGGSGLPAAASPVQAEGQGDAGQQADEQPEQQLSVAEQQQLLSLKVDALLQLLSSVSFHQVRAPVLGAITSDISCHRPAHSLLYWARSTAKLHRGAGLQAQVALCSSMHQLNFLAGIDVMGT